MSLQRRKERHQSETEEEKAKREEKKREKKCLCFDMGGMRRNRRIALKDFLIISCSLMRFLFQENQKDMTTVMSYASMTKFSFSSQSLDNKYKSHSQLNNPCCIFNFFPLSYTLPCLSLKLASNSHYGNISGSNTRMLFS